MSSVPKSHVFPPPPDRRYRLEDGRVRTRSLEAHIVDHCNLTCAECCSFSPLLPPWCADPQELERDVRRCASVLSPAVFKLVGGEPLLHPGLLEILQRVRRTVIAPVISLTTNGLLLGEMPDAFWSALDALTISRYPRPRLSAQLIAQIESRAAQFHVRLNWKMQDQFVHMSRDPSSAGIDETQRVFHDCWIRERCHMVRGGVFYTCTRPPHLHTLHRGRINFSGDGVRLHGGPGLREELLTYLQRDEPLQACFHCRGGNAAMQPHRLLRRAQIEAQRAAYE